MTLLTAGLSSPFQEVRRIDLAPRAGASLQSCMVAASEYAQRTYRTGSCVDVRFPFGCVVVRVAHDSDVNSLLRAWVCAVRGTNREVGPYIRTERPPSDTELRSIYDTRWSFVCAWRNLVDAAPRVGERWRAMQCSDDAALMRYWYGESQGGEPPTSRPTGEPDDCGPVTIHTEYWTAVAQAAGCWAWMMEGDVLSKGIGSAVHLRTVVLDKILKGMLYVSVVRDMAIVLEQCWVHGGELAALGEWWHDTPFK